MREKSQLCGKWRAFMWFSLVLYMKSRKHTNDCTPMAPRPPAVCNFQQGEDLEDLEHVTENFQGEKANYVVNAQNKN